MPKAARYMDIFSITLADAFFFASIDFWSETL